MGLALSLKFVETLAYLQVCWNLQTARMRKHSHMAGVAVCKVKCRGRAIAVRSRPDASYAPFFQSDDDLVDDGPPRIVAVSREPAGTVEFITVLGQHCVLRDGITLEVVRHDAPVAVAGDVIDKEL